MCFDLLTPQLLAVTTLLNLILLHRKNASYLKYRFLPVAMMAFKIMEYIANQFAKRLASAPPHEECVRRGCNNHFPAWVR